MSLSILQLAEDLAKGKRMRVPPMNGPEWRYFCSGLNITWGTVCKLTNGAHSSAVFFSTFSRRICRMNWRFILSR